LAAHAQTTANADAADTRSQRMKLIGAIVILAAAGGIVWYQIGGRNEAVHQAEVRKLQCASTGKTFAHDLVLGEIEPMKCEICGKMDAYWPEACYWTKDASGKWAIKEVPSYVILPRRMDPEGASTAKCPDCGRRVVGHNPRPTQADIDRANGGETEPSDEGS